jgi:hypothetical protein
MELLGSGSSSSSSSSSSMDGNTHTLSIPVIPASPEHDDSKPFFVQRVESRFRKVLVRQWPSFVRRVHNRFRKSLCRSWDCAQSASGQVGSSQVPRGDAKLQSFKLFY